MAKFNYIQNLIKQNGENWIVSFSPMDIQNRIAPRVIKDMVRGFIDYEKYGQYFLDSKFLSNLIIACTNELEINNLYATSLEFYQQYHPNVPNIGIHVNHLKSLCYIYNLLVSRLSMVQQTSNIGYLADVAALLRSYKNHLN